MTYRFKKLIVHLRERSSALYGRNSHDEPWQLIGIEHDWRWGR